MNFFKRKIIWISLVAVLFAGGYFWFFGGEDGPQVDFAVAQLGDIVQEVSVTGRVKALENVELGFEKSGRIARVYVRVGEKVSTGEILLELDHRELDASLLQAEAKIKVEDARLQELQVGTRPEEIKVQQVKVANARQSVLDSERNLEDLIDSGFTKADDAVRNKTDQLFSNPRTVPQFNFALYDGNLESKIESGRQAIEKLLIEWQRIDALSRLAAIKNFLSDVSLAVNSLMANSGLTQATLDGYKADIFTARTNVDAAIANILAANEELSDQQSALVLAEEELILKLAGTLPEKLVAQEAALEEAKASADNLRAQIAKNVLRSPIAGTISRNDAKLGEIIAANAKLVSVISNGDFKIEVNLPEVDVAKIQLGNTAKVTLDAYGSTVLFEAEVVEIEPAETILEGVATYKTTLLFSEPDMRIKSGMTANVDVLADSRSGVILIPQRAIVIRGGMTIVRKFLTDNSIEEVEVEPGLRGSDGNTEIISGISEGDRVVTFINE